jgi:hypothetical protein
MIANHFEWMGIHQSYDQSYVDNAICSSLTAGQHRAYAPTQKAQALQVAQRLPCLQGTTSQGLSSTIQKGSINVAR